MFASLVMVLKLSKKVSFLQFCGYLNKKPKPVKAIYIHARERSRYALSENDIVYRGLSHRYYEILAIKISKKILTQQKFDKILQLQTLISPEQ